MHPCSKEDLELFYEPEPTSVQKVEIFKEKGGLFCFDWKSAAFDLYGTWRSDVRMTAVDIMMVPCGTQYQKPDGTVAETRDDCIWDKQETMDYFGSLQF